MSTWAGMGETLVIRLPFRIRHVQLMPHIIENILKLYLVGSVRFHESLVSLQHEALLLGVTRFLLRSRAKFQLLRLALDGGSRTLHVEELIQSEAAQQAGIAVIHIDCAQAALTELAEAKSDPGKGSHKCRIHLLTIAQVDHKIPVAALDHLFDELLESRAVLEGAAAFHLYPDGAIDATDEDR